VQYDFLGFLSGAVEVFFLPQIGAASWLSGAQRVEAT
jgi:hypothetical protein